ncbi:hypothetical protein QAD02_019260 [Eretmocerus hayati]|uniref:Uncharacterized protein n=1 Tax=Eretmocerus hayati TaxID=131215 RepID=A0ACC2PJ36_9HYME|nr:hypothetical protein QAD02_019260 [Eretmocerus hayati]
MEEWRTAVASFAAADCAEEVDESSVNGDSGAEEDEDEDLSQASGSESSGDSTNSSTTSDSGEESAEGDEQTSSSSESESSDDEDEEESEAVEHPEERWETCAAGGTKVKLPQDMCEHKSIFKEMLNYPKFWDECLDESQKESLYSLLPTFPQELNSKAELDKTLSMLFKGEIDRFGNNPLDDFHNHLSAGHFRPDIKKMRTSIKKAQKKKYLFEERKRAYELTGQLLKSRETLLSSAYKQGFGHVPQRHSSKISCKKPKPDTLEKRATSRYVEELKTISAEACSGSQIDLSSDSDSLDEDSSCTLMTPAQARDEAIRPVYSTLEKIGLDNTIGGLVTNLGTTITKPDLSDEAYKSMLLEHKKRRLRKDTHPELNTQGISLSDVMQRAQLGQKHKLSFTARTPNTKKRVKTEQHLSPMKVESDSTSHTSGDYSLHSSEGLRHSITIEQPDQKPPECLLATEEIKEEPEFIKVEPIEPKYEIEPPAAQLPPTIMDEEPEPVSNEIPSPVASMDVKQEIDDLDYKPFIKIEAGLIPDEKIPMSISIPLEVEGIDKKEIDLDSIDMMQLPIQLDDGIDLLADVKCEDGNVITIPDKELGDSIEDFVINGDELMQETHCCFFSLIRDSFLSKGEYRMHLAEVRDAVVLWQDNPISPLNDWYSLAPSWPDLVPLALSFLAGELVYSQDQFLDGDQEFVPYVDNKGMGVYAWIGAGRDSDSRLSVLCTTFLMYRESLVPPIPVVPVSVFNKHQQIHNQQQMHANLVTMTNHAESSILNLDVLTDGQISELSSQNPESPDFVPPKALNPTTWKVRLSTPEEREEFRRQERMRYAAPHKAFTYKLHGYLAVVGPVKGIYQPNTSGIANKARGHTILMPERPSFVTILALVRDAVARLPNGEGTRAEICMLLRDSQYIQEDMFVKDKEANLNSIVSGALDRLHYEHDPCVKYYPKRKEWLYLHRARSEFELEVCHQQQQGMPKSKKSSGGSSKNKGQAAQKALNAKEKDTTTKEPTPKKEKKNASQSGVSSRKESAKKQEDKSATAAVQPVSVNDQLAGGMASQQNLPTQILPLSPITSSSTAVQPPLIIDKDCPATVIPTAVDSKPLPTISNVRDMNTMTSLASVLSTSPSSIKKSSGSNVNVKSVAVVKPTGAAQSLLQSNQQHYPHHQIQVSTSAGVQTIRLSGHSVLQSSQPITSSAATTTANVATIYPTGTKIMQSGQIQPVQQAQTILATQPGKSLLHTSNLKQQQVQQQVLPGKTLLTSQIKLVSSGQIKSLLTGHGLQGQTFFIKQAPSTSQAQVQVQQQQQSQIQQRVVPSTAVTATTTARHQHQIQQQQTLQTSGMQRIVTQIGGKPIAVQIQQPQQTQQVHTQAQVQIQSQQKQQQNVLAKVLSNTGVGQLISVESLLQKGIKLATTATHTNHQLARQGSKLVQTQYQVVTQAQTSATQPKIIVSTSAQAQQQQLTVQPQQRTTAQQQQAVRMVTAQLAGKPIVLTNTGGAPSTPSNKPTITSNVVIQSAKHPSTILHNQQQTQQQIQQIQHQGQSIILPSQLLNIKTLHGLKVIPTAAGLKTTGTAVYARVLAPTSVAQGQTPGVVVQQQHQTQTQTIQLDTNSQHQNFTAQHQQHNARGSPFGGAQ